MAVSHFIDEKTEAQRGQIICSGSHSQEVASPDWKPAHLREKAISGRGMESTDNEMVGGTGCVQGLVAREQGGEARKESWRDEAPRRGRAGRSWQWVPTEAMEVAGGVPSPVSPGPGHEDAAVLGATALLRAAAPGPRAKPSTSSSCASARIQLETGKF